MSKKEVRFLTPELRAEENEAGEAFLEGYPIVFNQETNIGGICREVIDPGAVEEPMLRDVALMVGHDFGMIPLARSRRNNENSTMRLGIDEKGVPMRASLDIRNNPKAKEAYSAVKRSDLSGMSFAFTVEKEAWEDLDTDMPLRRILKFGKIFEVSLVAFPAYPGTNVQAASEDDALESVAISLESARKQLEKDRAAQAEQERRTALLERLNNLTKEGSDE